MTTTKKSTAASDVARWHRLSGLPDNVTDEGEIVDVDAGRRLQSEKDLLRAAIARLGHAGVPPRVRGMARLASSYLLAGDVETARRCLAAAQDLFGDLTSPDAASTAAAH